MWHINPVTHEMGVCRAKIECRFAGTEHYSNAGDALNASLEADPEFSQLRDNALQSLQKYEQIEADSTEKEFAYKDSEADLNSKSIVTLIQTTASLGAVPLGGVSTAAVATLAFGATASAAAVLTAILPLVVGAAAIGAVRLAIPAIQRAVKKSQLNDTLQQKDNALIQLKDVNAEFHEELTKHGYNVDEFDINDLKQYRRSWSEASVRA